MKHFRQILTILCLLVAGGIMSSYVVDKGSYKPGGICDYHLYYSYDLYWGDTIHKHYYALITGIRTQYLAEIPEYVTCAFDGNRYYVEGIGDERISAANTIIKFKGDVKYWNHSIVVQGLEEIYFEKQYFDFQGQTSDYFENSIGGVIVHVVDVSPAQVAEMKERSVWEDFEDIIPYVPTYNYTLSQTSTGGVTDFYDIKNYTYVGTSSLSYFTKLASLNEPGTSNGSVNRWGNYAVVLNCDLETKIPHLKRAGVEVPLETSGQLSYYKELDVQGERNYEVWYTDQLCEVTIQQHNRQGEFSYSYVLNDKPYSGGLSGNQCMILAPRGGQLTLELPANGQSLTRYTVDGVEHTVAAQNGKFTCEITLPKQGQSTIVLDWEYIAPSVTLKFLRHGGGENHSWLMWDDGVYEYSFDEGTSQETIPIEQLSIDLNMYLDVKPGETFKVYKNNTEITSLFQNDYNPTEYYLELDKESAKYTVIYEPSTIKNIEFADLAVKAICVENWDTNGDGELSYEEAAAVTDIGEVFKGNTEITSFDELQYFTGLTKIGKEAFREATSLTSVVLPQSVVSIQGGWTFYGCSSLENVVLPDNLSMIDSYTFGRTAIKSIKLPEKGSVVLGYSAFQETPLRSLYIPANLTGTIYKDVVSKCPDLTNIAVDEGNRYYDSREGCNAIIKKADNKLIASCKNTVIPESVKALGDNAFFYTTVKKLDLPAGLTSMGATSLFNCDSLTSIVAHMPEPFTISTANIQGLPNNCVLTVPYGKRQAYIDAGWTESIFKGGVVEDKSQFDVNRDSSVSIADVTTLVNVILGKPIQ